MIVNVKNGEEFQIRLKPEYSGSGYLWNIYYDVNDFELISNDSYMDTDLVGSPTIKIFRLRPKRIGDLIIKAFHKRPWEEEVLEQIDIVVKSYGDVAESGLLRLS